MCTKFQHLAKAAPEILLTLEKRLSKMDSTLKKKNFGTNQTSLRQYLKILCLVYFSHMHVE